MSARALRFHVIGDPIAHSLSPRMHQAAYAARGLPHVYTSRRVGATELAAVVDELRRGEIDGLNVTLPHKRAALALADDLDTSASLAGAANTLVRSLAGRVVAYNTDVAAIGRELLDMGARPGGAVVVLGDGGAARAAVAAAVLHLDAARVIVRARAFADGGRASAFAEEMAPRVGSAELVLEPLAWRDAGVVACMIQATSAGMRGGAPGDAVAATAPWASLVPGGAALDLVYAPPVTPFLREAAARGILRENGLGVLVRQGARAFELWLGEPAPLHEMRAAVSGSDG